MKRRGVPALAGTLHLRWIVFANVGYSGVDQISGALRPDRP